MLAHQESISLHRNYEYILEQHEDDYLKIINPIILGEGLCLIFKIHDYLDCC
jgi:hypothetical protein